MDIFNGLVGVGGGIYWVGGHEWTFFMGGRAGGGGWWHILGG